MRIQSAEERTPPVASDSSQSELPGDALPCIQRQNQLKAYHDQIKNLASQGLPIGYACLGAEAPPCNPCDVASWPLKIAGLLLTALAAMLGAPFWFDLINRAVSLRGSGSKPNGTRK